MLELDFVSSAKGINGGYTIANSVVIENAIGGIKSDISLEILFQTY